MRHIEAQRGPMALMNNLPTDVLCFVFSRWLDKMFIIMP